jgi:hypothetical protein
MPFTTGLGLDGSWSAAIAHLKNGAPRPMKMGTIASLWRYDAVAARAIRPGNLRRTAILRYA